MKRFWGGDLKHLQTVTTMQANTQIQATQFPKVQKRHHHYVRYVQLKTENKTANIQLPATRCSRLLRLDVQLLICADELGHSASTTSASQLRVPA